MSQRGTPIPAFYTSITVFWLSSAYCYMYSEIVGGLVLVQYGCKISAVVPGCLCPFVFLGSNLSPVGTIMFRGGRAPKAALDPGGTSTSIGPDVEMSRCQSSSSNFANFNFLVSGFHMSHVLQRGEWGHGGRK